MPVADGVPRAHPRRQDHRVLRQPVCAARVRHPAAPPLHLRRHLPRRPHAHPVQLQKQPPGEHGLPVKGGRQLHRRPGRQRAAADIVARGVAPAGGAAAGPHPPGQARAAGGRRHAAQRLLLHPGLPGHAGDVLLHQAAAVPGGPGLRLQGGHQPAGRRRGRPAAAQHAQRAAQPAGQDSVDRGGGRSGGGGAGAGCGARGGIRRQRAPSQGAPGRDVPEHHVGRGWPDVHGVQHQVKRCLPGGCGGNYAARSGAATATTDTAAMRRPCRQRHRGHRRAHKGRSQGG
mmetsp:Transcript_36104/g.93786  ORF Transcript_36104/g.93786 Transcript_36104/m.93786 type:complete len:287 (+) Transcript_36104:924-1784(+)